jgi:hypothetical protein
MFVTDGVGVFVGVIDIVGVIVGVIDFVGVKLIVGVIDIVGVGVGGITQLVFMLMNTVDWPSTKL